MTASLYCGDSLTVLRSLPDGVARCCVTSPPYWGLRDYGVAGQLGLEATPDAYVARMVEVFAEVRRVLADDGTLWLNLGDSYGGYFGEKYAHKPFGADRTPDESTPPNKPSNGKMAKNLVGIPWRVAFALQADGWYLRSDIIWSKPNPMPESVTDRPTKAHEYVFLLSKRAKYYYDAASIAEPVSPNTHARLSQDVMAQEGSRRANGGTDPDRPFRAGGRSPGVNPKALLGVQGREKQNASFSSAICMPVSERNARSVWSIATQPYPEAHFATFPEELARRCILAGSAPTDTVLDPFGGSGTVAQVATGNGRKAIHIDLNPAYIELARMRIGPMLCA